jgi:hypothetical protein
VVSKKVVRYYAGAQYSDVKGKQKGDIGSKKNEKRGHTSFLERETGTYILFVQSSRTRNGDMTRNGDIHPFCAITRNGDIHPFCAIQSHTRVILPRNWCRPGVARCLPTCPLGAVKGVRNLLIGS